MAEPDRPTRVGRATGREAIKVHIGLALALAICVPAGIFELTRALGGNTLSWAYTFEWPIFAGFAFYMWWRLLNGDPVIPEEIAFNPNDPKAQKRKALSAEETTRLEQWNDYLRALERSDKDSGLGPSAPTNPASH